MKAKAVALSSLFLVWTLISGLPAQPVPELSGELARADAARALELDPGSFAAHFALGQSLLEVDPPDLDLSIRSLEEASRLAPDVASVRFVLSRAYQRAGRTEDAARQREEFRRLTELKEEWVRKVLK